jgi:hypothetical protein
MPAARAAKRYLAGDPSKEKFKVMLAMGTEGGRFAAVLTYAGDFLEVKL